MIISFSFPEKSGGLGWAHKKKDMSLIDVDSILWQRKVGRGWLFSKLAKQYGHMKLRRFGLTPYHYDNLIQSYHTYS